MNEFGTHVAIFKSLIRGEFHFLPVSQIEIIKSWSGLISFEYYEQMSLVDKDGKLVAVLNTITKVRPSRNTPESIVWIANSLINGLLFTRNLLLRKEIAHAHQSFFYLHKYILWLIRISVDSTAHWESPTKKTEQDFPLIWYGKYMACVPALDEADLAISFQACTQLCDELFNRLQVSDSLIEILKQIETTSKSITNTLK